MIHDTFCEGYFSDRAYWAFVTEAPFLTLLNSDLPRLLLTPEGQPSIQPLDPIFVFADGKLVAIHQIRHLGTGMGVRIPKSVRLVPCSTRVIATQTDRLHPSQTLRDKTRETQIRHAQAKVVDAALRRRHAEVPPGSAAWRLPVEVGDQLLTAFNLPFIRYCDDPMDD